MGEKTSARESWGSWWEFCLATLGYMVGLGNIWRFPYICYINGGGAFLIPFLLFMVVCAIPIVFLEMSYTQFASLGPGRAWRICPLFKGIGVGMALVIGLVTVYYNVIISWALYYLFMSLRAVLPWNTCNNEWNTNACTVRLSHVGNSTNGSLLLNSSILVSSNITMQAKTSTEEFWQYHVLEMSTGIEHLGILRWQLVLCHLVTWLVVFFCVLKGIKTFGKVAYVTATVPYIILLILLIRGAMLPGALDGLKYYLIPQWSKLREVQVWTAAAIQIFFSVGCGGGGVVTLASYNGYHNNIIRDAFLFPLLDVATCLLCGLVVFVVLGFMSHSSGLPIDKVVAEGPGIAFMVYPEALAQLPLAPMWSAFFFLVLFIVGLDSQFVHVEIVVGALADMFPSQIRKRRTIANTTFIVLAALLALPCLTQGGVYVLQVMDWYTVGLSVPSLVLVELLVISYIYGVPRLFKDIELMLGVRPSRFWVPFLKLITPSAIVFILLSSIIMHVPVHYGEYHYPGYAIGFGWFYGVISILAIPIFAGWTILRAEGSFIERLRTTLKPSRNWGPAAPENRDLYLASLTNDAENWAGCFGLLRKGRPTGTAHNEPLRNVSGMTDPIPAKS